MTHAKENVLKAIAELKSGRMIILTDHPDRENEGDLVIPAENITPEIMNFMIRNGTGIVCLALNNEYTERLHLPLMVANNSSKRGTPFTLSIDAKDGITTGVSASDRAHTVKLAVTDHVRASDFVKPGHIFPLQARDGGVLERNGHTEGSIDLAILAGYKPAAVICEIMNPDGTMAAGKQITEFAKQHQFVTVSIDDLIFYRQYHENMIDEITTPTTIPILKYGTFNAQVVKEKYTQLEHLVLYKNINKNSPLVRIHSSCSTGDIFSSQRCDCNQQLHCSLEKISQQGGMLIYLNQEGRGIGLLNKIKSYVLQDQGLNTIEANQQLHLPVDARHYYIAAHVLRHFKIEKLQLLTNNPHKCQELQKFDLVVVMKPLPTFHNEYNHAYLKTKLEQFKHQLQLHMN